MGEIDLDAVGQGCGFDIRKIDVRNFAYGWQVRPVGRGDSPLCRFAVLHIKSRSGQNAGPRADAGAHFLIFVPLSRDDRDA